MNWAALQQKVNRMFSLVYAWIAFIPAFVSKTAKDVEIEIENEDGAVEVIRHPNIAKMKEDVNRRLDDLKVSFSANHFCWSNTDLQTFPSVLKADHIESNRGDAYDPQTGIFTAPSEGSYLFATTVFVNSLSGENADGSKPDFVNETKWIEDMHININRYDKDAAIRGDGTGADKIGECWIGEVGRLVDGNKRAKWMRKSASATAIHYLKKGEKVCLEWVVWNNANKGDKVMMSFNFSGTKIH